MANINLVICDPENHRVAEDQTYYNESNLTLGQIALMMGKDKTMPPEIGNFPHMAGHGKPVKILEASITDDEEQSSLDVSEILERYKELGN